MVDEFTAICMRFGQMATRGGVQIAEISLNVKLWQENFTPEQPTCL